METAGVSSVGDDLGIPEVDLELKSGKKIVAKTRKLKAYGHLLSVLKTLLVTTVLMLSLN